ncbi:MAG: DUF6265 family protein [Acidobacteriota bacterium]
MSDRIASALLVLAAAFAFSPTSASAASPDSMTAVAWMAGDWSGVDEQGVSNEERWIEPAGGMMLGVHRDITSGKATAFEFLRIESTPEGIVYFASPGGKPPTPFKMIESGDKRVVFENPQLEFPRRILYWLGKLGEMHARIEGAGGGKAMAVEWTWRRK